MNYLFSIGLLIILVVLSGFFSSSETGMMSINRYRLRHLARSDSRPALRVLKLLSRPDRLLGVILIGNTFANVLASAVATMLAIKYFGEGGVFLVMVALTVIILIFAETAPKTLAALHPEKVAFSVSLPLKWLLKIFYPLVWLVNFIANGLLRLFRVKMKNTAVDPLSAEELRTVVLEASGKISSNYQQMLLSILDLGHVTAEDVLVPKSEVYGIDLQTKLDNIHQQLLQCPHSHVPLYKESFDQLEGMLNVRKALAYLVRGELSLSQLTVLSEKVYFVPECVSLNQLLVNFQDQHRDVGLVVDEYGEVQGLVTLRDVLEEIVGEFAKVNVSDVERIIRKQKNGSVLVDGGINIRDLNRIAGWDFPTDGPKTLSGLIIEYLEMIPESGMGVRVAGYPIEILQIDDNMVAQVRIWPELYG